MPSGGGVAVSHAIADTSVFIARESGRPIRADLLAEHLAVSIITIGELRAGVLAAAELDTREQRLRTLTATMALDPLPIDDGVATEWARLRVRLRDEGLRMPVNDSWIAATAMTHDLPLVTQDDDYPELDGLRIVRV